MDFDLKMYLANEQAENWHSVEIQLNGKRESVVEILAKTKHAAFVLAIQSMSAADLDRACDGVTLRILSN